MFPKQLASCFHLKKVTLKHATWWFEVFRCFSVQTGTQTSYPVRHVILKPGTQYHVKDAFPC